MIFSYQRLLKEANLTNVSIEQIIDAINSIGFEVESFTKFTNTQGVEFGHVLKTYKNPNADRLTVCEIEFANNVHRTIQTTATNVKENDYLMAFVPGSVTNENLKIQARTMQGIISEGMLVGLSEIGIPYEFAPEKFNDQIFTFGKVDLNLDPMKYFEIDDYLIDVTILSNRADAMCYLIFAKELAAYFNSKINEIKPTDGLLESTINVKKQLVKTNSLSYVEALNKDISLSIQDQFFLWKHKIKTFDNAVDLTNLTLLYAGVPCHVYSDKDLKSNEFSTALVSNKVTILGNKEIQLDNNLVIKNGDDIVSVAQVIGLENYSDIDNAKKLVFELGSFDLKEIRKSAKTLKLVTNASQRGSREISGGQIILAYNYLSTKLKLHSQLINKPKIKSQTIFLDDKQINQYAGFNITKTDKFKNTLKQLEILGFKFHNKMHEITFPSYRYDLFGMQDLIEEIFRFYGYNNFNEKKISTDVFLINDNDKYQEIATKFVAKGYTNCRTFTLTNPSKNIFNPFNFEHTIKVLNSKNFEHTEIRNSMIFSLYDIMLHNKKQGIEKASFYEIGMINNVTNVLSLCSNEKPFDEICTDIISLTNKKLDFKKSNLDIFNPNSAALIYLNEKLVGYVANLNPSYLKTEAIFAEIMLDELSSKNIIYKPYKKDPLKSRDVTFNIKQGESIEHIMQQMSLVKGIYEIKVKDVYKKDDGTGNVTISVILEDWATKKFDSLFNK